MAHPADPPRRGSGTSSNSSVLHLSAGSGVGGHVLPSDDYQTPLLVQPPPPPAATSSPAPQQHPPQTLNLMPSSPCNTVLPVKPQAQMTEPAVQGMINQVPAVSPLLTATNVPPGISSAVTNMAPLSTVAQPSVAPNGNLVQSANQAPVAANLPVAQSIPAQMTASVGQFLAPSLIQSVASQTEDARRLMEQIKELIKELMEKNSQLEHENSLLKTLASPEQLAQFQAQLQSGSPPSSSSSSCSQPTGNTPATAQPTPQSSGPTA